MLQITIVKCMINPRAAAALSPSMRDEGRLRLFIDNFRVIGDTFVVAPSSNGKLSPDSTGGPLGVKVPR